MTNHCSNEPCTNAIFSKGLCNPCYQRERYRKMTDEQRKKRADYDRKYHSLHRTKRNATCRDYSHRVHRPTSVKEWERYLWRRVQLNSGTRGHPLAELMSRSSIRDLLQKAIEDGDVSLSDEIRAPSPDRIDNSLGYIEGNVQIIPRWLNIAYNNWDKSKVNEAILAWAASRLSK